MTRVWEITFAFGDRRPFARDERERRSCLRALARCFARAPEPELIAFCLRGGRLRVMVHGTGRAVGYRRSALRRALGACLGRRLPAPALRTLDHRAHVVSVLRAYVAPGDRDEPFDQPAPLATGSCFADLVGMRRVDRLRLGTARLLPRLGERDLWAMVAAAPPPPVDGRALRSLGPSRIAAAAAFATAAPPALEGRGHEVLAARRATAELARRAGIAPRETAWALGMTERGLRKLSCGPGADRWLLGAVRLRLAAEGALEGRGLLAR